jgi:hypothetical protein
MSLKFFWKKNIRFGIMIHRIGHKKEKKNVLAQPKVLSSAICCRRKIKLSFSKTLTSQDCQIFREFEMVSRQLHFFSIISRPVFTLSFINYESSVTGLCRDWYCEKLWYTTAPESEEECPNKKKKNRNRNWKVSFSI